jgi:hypothetical protein
MDVEVKIAGEFGMGGVKVKLRNPNVATRPPAGKAGDRKSDATANGDTVCELIAIQLSVGWRRSRVNEKPPPVAGNVLATYPKQLRRVFGAFEDVGES